jgi:polyisoprenoid-binding protein YceI
MMNIRAKVLVRAPSVVRVAAILLVSIVAIATGGIGRSAGEEVQKTPAPGPGTAVVQSGVRATHIDFAQIPAGTYDITSKETLVRYEVDHMGFTTYWGTFPGATGTLELDPNSLQATKLEVKVPIAQVETTNRELNGQLFSDEFFDAENYPWMRFNSTSVVRVAPKRFRVTGDLTMHNITKPIVLDVIFHGAGNDPFTGKGTILGFDATGTVKRSEFGLGKYVPIVGDETTIIISAEFKMRSVDHP